MIIVKKVTYNLGISDAWRAGHFMDVDVPWEPDPVRYRPDDRAPFLERCRRALGDRPFITVSGDRASRLRQATAAIDRLLDECTGAAARHRS